MNTFFRKIEWITVALNKALKQSSKTVIFIYAAIVVFSFFYQGNWKKEKVIIWDAINYYSYLPATFIYKDISGKFVDTYTGSHKFIIASAKLESGKRVEKMSMGLSFLLLPFFLIAHAITLCTSYDAGGFSPLYHLAIQFANIFYLTVGLFFLRKLLLQWFNDKLVSLTFLIVLIGSNLHYFTVFDSGVTHSFNFSLISVFVYLVVEWYKSPSAIKSLIIGLLIGLISLIRPSNVIVALFFLLYGLTSIKEIFPRIRFLFRHLWMIILLVVTVFIVWLPQFAYWKYVTGNWIYYSYGSEGFFFDNPHILEGLIGYRKGWLLYTPVMMFCIIGLVPLYRYLKGMFFPILILFLLHVYIIFSWWCWWYGGGFGARPMIDIYPLLAIPLCAFLSWLTKTKRVIKVSITTIIIFLSLFGVVKSTQCYYGIIHYDGMTKELYWKSLFVKKRIPGYWGMLERPNYDLAVKGIYKFEKTR